VETSADLSPVSNRSHVSSKPEADDQLHQSEASPPIAIDSGASEFDDRAISCARKYSLHIFAFSRILGTNPVAARCGTIW
jgi:hypothetical protein